MSKKYRLCSALALAVAVTACADSGPKSPLSPSSLQPPTSSAAIADAKLKANAPSILAPANGSTLGTMTPALVVATTSARFAQVTLQYQFQVLRGSTVVADSGLVDADGGQASYTVQRGVLQATTTYTWRARAVFQDAGGPWATASFETPTPSPGAQCASTDHNYIISCVSARFPEKLEPRDNDDLGRRRDMEFLRDRVIEAGVCGGLAFGWNTKADGHLSIDFIAWRDRDGSNPHNGPGVEDWGIDLAFDYDNNANPLVLSWRPHGSGANWTEYRPTPVCIG
jgi:hypothetical protein